MFYRILRERYVGMTTWKLVPVLSFPRDRMENKKKNHDKTYPIRFNHNGTHVVFVSTINTGQLNQSAIK